MVTAGALLGRSKRPENSARPDITARPDNTARTDNTTRSEHLGLYCDQLSEIRTGGRADRREEELVSRWLDPACILGVEVEAWRKAWRGPEGAQDGRGSGIQAPGLEARGRFIYQLAFSSWLGSW